MKTIFNWKQSLNELQDVYNGFNQRITMYDKEKNEEIRKKLINKMIEVYDSFINKYNDLNEKVGNNYNIINNKLLKLMDLY